MQGGELKLPLPLHKFFIWYRFPSLFSSFTSSRNFLFSSCSLGVISGEINMFLVSCSLCNLNVFLSTLAFSDSVETVILSNLGLSPRFPSLIALVIEGVTSTCF